MGLAAPHQRRARDGGHGGCGVVVRAVNDADHGAQGGTEQAAGLD